jgi:hypothetical protein
MDIRQKNGLLVIAASHYSLAVAPGRPFVYLQDALGMPLAELFVYSSVHTLQGRDDTVTAAPPAVEERDNQIVLSFTAGSSLWRQKEYRFVCEEESFRYEIELEGEGQLAEVHYLGGYYSAQLRWGSGFFGSGRYFSQGFTPEPNADERFTFGPGEGAAVDLMAARPGQLVFYPSPLLFGLPGFCRLAGGGSGGAARPQPLYDLSLPEPGRQLPPDAGL